MQRTKQYLLFARAAGLILPCAWAATYLLPPLNGDVAAILLFAIRMVRGDALYVDVIDVNPPLIFWLNLAPAWVSERLSLSPAAVFVAMAMLLQALAIALCLRPISRVRELQNDTGAKWLLCIATLGVVLVLPSNNFGQREVLMTTFALPYLAMAALRLSGSGMDVPGAALRAVFAAVGFLIKPYFLIVPLVIECAILARCGPRSTIRRPEPWIIAGCSIGYLAMAGVIHPAYFTEVVPLVRRYYLSSDLLDSVRCVFGTPERSVALTLLAPCVVYAVTNRRSPVMQVAGLFTIATALSAIAQGKGWPYHVLPLWQGGAIVVSGVVAGMLRVMARPGLLSRDGEQLVLQLGLVLGIGLYGLVYPPLHDRLAYHGSFAGRLEPLLDQHARGKSVLWLTDAIYPKYPVTLYDDVRPASRFMELWMLDSLYREAGRSGNRPAMREPGQMSADERRLFEIVGTSLERFRPALVLIASASSEFGVAPNAFDYLTYFLRHPAFAREWAHYGQVGEIDGTMIYRRLDGPRDVAARSKTIAAISP